MKPSARLSCPSCRTALTPREALVAGSVSWPTHRWVHFTCPTCGESAHLTVREGYLALGQIEGGPGPVWCATAEVHDPALRVDTETGGFAKHTGISVRLGDEAFWYPAKDPRP